MAGVRAPVAYYAGPVAYYAGPVAYYASPLCRAQASPLNPAQAMQAPKQGPMPCTGYAGPYAVHKASPYAVHRLSKTLKPGTRQPLCRA